MMDSKVAPNRLASLQRWMQSAIFDPNGLAISKIVGRGTDADFDRIPLDEVIKPSATLSGCDQLAIYWRSYRLRLLTCMREVFPCLHCLLGNDLFTQFCYVYFCHFPPKTYTLNKTADAFPEFLATTRPRIEDSEGTSELWSDLIIELARLELAFFQVYDGPGIERRPGDSLSEHTKYDSYLRNRNAKPTLASCIKLLEFSFPVHKCMLEFRRQGVLKIPTPSKSYIVLNRVNFVVVVDELNPMQYAVLKRLDGSSSIFEAVESLNGLQLAERLDECQLDLWISDWNNKRFFG